MILLNLYEYSSSLKDDFQAAFCYNTRRFFNPFRQPENLK